MDSQKATFHALRLKPGQDLKKDIEAYAQNKKINAGWIATCVGSLTQTHLRFANQPAGILTTGHFEIVSLTGTVSRNGCHLHVCVSNEKGECTGGHLLYENLIYTTAELIICESRDIVFTREKDDETGWLELRIGRKRK